MASGGFKWQDITIIATFLVLSIISVQLHTEVVTGLWNNLIWNITWYDQVRGTVADFAVFLSVAIWTIIDWAIGIDTPKLNVPSEFKPTRDDRFVFQLICILSQNYPSNSKNCLQKFDLRNLISSPKQCTTVLFYCFCCESVKPFSLHCLQNRFMYAY